MTEWIPKHKKWCRECRKQFLAKHPAALYCSSNCRKRYWDKNNRWQYQDNCPSCGGIKEKVSNFCQRCAPGNNPSGRNQFS